MGKNLVRKEFDANSTWTCPAGVKRVRVIATDTFQKQVDTAGAASYVIGISAPDPATYGDFAFSAGINTSGGLGNNTVTTISTPNAINGNRQWRLVAASPGLSAYGVAGTTTLMNGVAYAMGANESGQLGDNSVIPKSTPVTVVGAYRWKQLSGGGSIGAGTACGLDYDGQAYAWGANSSANPLGIGDYTPRSSPTLVIGGLTWKMVYAGAGYMVGVASDGTAYGWGNNANGQLGTGDAAAKSSPVVVVGGLSFKAIAAAKGGTHTLGLTTAGDIYAWGNNANGQLGDGTVTKKSSPVLVLGGKTWRTIAAGNDASYAIDTSGNLYAWGNNANGQLGDGTVVAKSSPVLVLGGFKWGDVSAGGSSAVGVLTSGGMYFWGANGSGQLMQGDTTPRSSPVLISGLILNMGTGSTMLRNALSPFDRVLSYRVFTVEPGTTYSVKPVGACVTFNDETVYQDGTYGSRTVKLTLEYFA